MAGTGLMRLVPLLGVPKCDPSRNREMGTAQALGGCQSFKKCNNQPNDGVCSGGVCLRRDTNEGDGNEGGRGATVTRAMATVTAMAMVMTWAMGMAMRLVGDKEGKVNGGNGNGGSNEGGGGQRG